MNKNQLLALPFFIVSLCAGCSLSGDTALDSPATVTQASSPANVVIRNQSTDFGVGGSAYGVGDPAIMPGDLDGDGFGDMVVVEGPCAHIIYGAGTLPHVLDTATTATLVGSSEMADNCNGEWSSSPTHPMPVHANWLGLAAAGDVDRDGFADFLVFFDGMNDIDKNTATVHLVGAYLVYGGPTRLTGRHLLAEASGAFFANAYAPTGLGDVNGDGFADIGALDKSLDMPDTAAGTAAVFFGSATRFTGEVPLDQAGAQLSIPAGYQFGLGLHSAGDLNGDGYADFVVGTFNDDLGDCNGLVSRVWIVLGGPKVGGALSLDTVPFIEGKIIGPYSDFAVPLGDLDGDGFDDLAVTTCHNPQQPGALASDTNILFGRPDLSTLPGSWNVTFPNTNALVSADVDGDGIRDLILADPSASNGNGNGVVYIRRGTGARLSGSIDPTLGSLAIPSSYRCNGSLVACGEFLGRWLMVGSDVDGDGLADILVGANVAKDANGDPINDPLMSTGHAYLLRGAAIKASLSR
jgi:hypothetical protein